MPPLAPAENPASSASIVFPAANDITDASTITIRGTASDADGVASVSVNGVSATTDNNYANWTANIPLQPGSNTITVTTSDSAGNAAAAQLTVQNELISPTPGSLVVDTENNRALILDPSIRAVVSLDLQTNERQVFSNATVPNTSNPFESPVAIVLDQENGRALVLDSGIPALLAVDLDSGIRTVISDDVLGGSHDYTMVMDKQRNRVLVSYGSTYSPPFLFESPILDVITPEPPVLIDFEVTSAPGSISAIDLTTGTATVFGSETVPDTDLPFYSPGALAVDAALDRLIVIDNSLGETGEDALFSVDLSSAQRTLLSSATIPDDLFPFGSLNGLVIDSTGNRALVRQTNSSSNNFEPPTQTLIQVDLVLGQRSPFSELELPLHLFSQLGFINFSSSQHNALAIDVNGNRLLSTHTDSNGTIVAIDLASEELTILAELPRTSGTDSPLGLLLAAEFSKQSNRLFVIDIIEGETIDTGTTLITQSLSRIVSVDASTGERTVVYELTAEAGIAANGGLVQLEDTNELVFEEIFVEGSTLALRLVALSLDSGVKRTLAENIEPLVPGLGIAGEFVLDETSQRAFSIVFEGIMAIDLTTGVSSLFVDVEPPPLFGGRFPFDPGPGIANIRVLALDNENRRLLYVDLLGGIRAVDLVSSEETVLVQAFSAGFTIGLEVDEERNRLLQLRPDAIWSVDLTSGEVTMLVSLDSTDEGAPVFQPAQMTVDTANDRLFVIDQVINAVYMIDLQTGQRVIFSR